MPDTAVDAYFEKVPAPFRAALQHLRETIAAAAPDAEEYIAYGMPAFRQGTRKNGKGIISYAAFKNHCSVFPMSGSVYDEMGDEVAPWRTSKGTLQFTPDNPIPDELIAKIIAVRLAEISNPPAKGHN